MGQGTELVVMGAAITAGRERDATDPATTLKVNLLAQVADPGGGAGGGRAAGGESELRCRLWRCRRAPARTRRDDAGRPGRALCHHQMGERARRARLGDLWGLDVVSLRLSGVFGPWEHATGVRDTLSPHCQILAAAAAGQPAILPRPGLRDWIYAPDVADAVLAVAGAEKLGHGVYNVSTGMRFTLLDWGQRLAQAFPASSAGWRSRARRRPSISTGLPTVRRWPWPGSRMTSVGRRRPRGWRRPTGSLPGGTRMDGRWRRDDETCRQDGTGHGRGLRHRPAIALLFAAEGTQLALVDRDEAGLAGTQGQIAAAGGAAIIQCGDVGEPGFGEGAVAACAARFGGLDVLVTAAGFSCGGTVTTTAPDDWDAVFRANVGGTFLFARAAIPQMQARGGGAIVTFASQLALAGGRGNSAYIAAKGAILSLTRTMALDYAADGHPRERDRARRHRHADAAAQLRPPCRSGAGARGLAQPPCDEALRPGGGGGAGRPLSRQRCLILQHRHDDGRRWWLAGGLRRSARRRRWTA